MGSLQQVAFVYSCSQYVHTRTILFFHDENCIWRSKTFLLSWKNGKITIANVPRKIVSWLKHIEKNIGWHEKNVLNSPTKMYLTYCNKLHCICPDSWLSFQSFVPKQKHAVIKIIYTRSICSEFLLFFLIFSAKGKQCNIGIFYEDANSCKPDYIMLSSRCRF